MLQGSMGIATHVILKQPPAVFQRHCITGNGQHYMTALPGIRHVFVVQLNCGPSQDYRQRVCVADEHYVPTVLAAYGQNQARNGYGGLTYSFFPPDAHHPRSFPPGHLRTALQEMKCSNWDGCAHCICCSSCKASRTVYYCFRDLQTGRGAGFASE